MVNIVRRIEFSGESAVKSVEKSIILIYLSKLANLSGGISRSDDLVPLAD